MPGRVQQTHAPEEILANTRNWCSSTFTQLKYSDAPQILIGKLKERPWSCDTPLSTWRVHCCQPAPSLAWHVARITY